MDALLQDIRYAVRHSVRFPGFTAVAVLALAIGIGANTAIFTLVNAVLIEPLPYRNPSRLVVLWETNARRPGRPNVVAPANYLRWQDRATAFDEMAGFYEYRVNLTGNDQPEEVTAQDVTANFFSTIGVAPLIGRPFAADEGPSGHNRVTLLSYALWQRRFGSDPSILGRTIQLSSRPFTVIGVMPPDVTVFLKAGSLVGKLPELWTPFAFTEAHRQPRGRYMLAIARLNPDVSLPQAQAQMDAIAAGLTREFPEFDTGWAVRVVPIRDELAGDIKPALLLLSGAVGLVLLIACANVANLLLARGAARQRELAIRSALGAKRGRLIRQLLTESLVLGGAGGALGLLVAQWSLDAMLAVSPVDLSALGHVRLNDAVLAFTGALSLMTTVVFGLAPAFAASRANAPEAMQEGARQVGATREHRRLRETFVVAEIALAVSLLAVAGLMLRSLHALRAVNPGFNASNVLTARVSLPMAKYSDEQKRLQFFRDAVARLASRPGVRSVGSISFLPFAGLGAATGFTIVGQPPPRPGDSYVVDVKVCDNGYFRTMGVPLLRGRLFTDREMQERSDVVVINETLARRYFPDRDPVGQQLAIDMMSPVVPSRIIGVVGDTKNTDLVSETRPMSYWPPPLLAYTAMTLVVRTASDASRLAPVLEAEVQSLDRDQPLSDVRTMDQWVAKSLAQTRFSSLLLAGFAAVALLLAAVGIYGVMSYAVNQRTTEIGLRLALGAERRDILRMVLGNAARLTVIGLGLGVTLALGFNRAATALLFQVTSTDPLTLGGGVTVLAGVALVATYLPASRASRIAPVEALRHQ